MCFSCQEENNERVLSKIHQSFFFRTPLSGAAASAGSRRIGRGDCTPSSQDLPSEGPWVREMQVKKALTTQATLLGKKSSLAGRPAANRV